MVLVILSAWLAKKKKNSISPSPNSSKHSCELVSMGFQSPDWQEAAMSNWDTKFIKLQNFSLYNYYTLFTCDSGISHLPRIYWLVSNILTTSSRSSLADRSLYGMQFPLQKTLPWHNLLIKIPHLLLYKRTPLSKCPNNFLVMWRWRSLAMYSADGNRMVSRASVP